MEQADLGGANVVAPGRDQDWKKVSMSVSITSACVGKRAQPL